jgi:acetyltransferase-like isoleucine patch superfamily enzyme
MKQMLYSAAGRLLCRLTNLRNRTQVQIWKQELGSVHPTTILEYPLKIFNGQCIHIGPRTRISWGSWLCGVTSYSRQRFEPEIRIGKNSYIGNHAHIIAAGKVHIGDDVLLADKVYVSDNLHEYRDTSRTIMWNDLICCGEVHIGDGSWLGENVCVVGNVRIGRHCVVGSNAVVRQDLPDYSVAVGIPASVIKRFNPEREQWERTDPDGSFRDDPDCRASLEGPAEEAVDRMVRGRR